MIFYAIIPAGPLGSCCKAKVSTPLALWGGGGGGGGQQMLRF